MGPDGRVEPARSRDRERQATVALMNERRAIKRVLALQEVAAETAGA